MNTNRFIFNKIAPEEELSGKVNNVGSLKRTIAIAIDSLILLFIRAVLLQIYISLRLVDSLNNFLFDFKNEFGVETPKRVPEHVKFIVNHPIFIEVLLLILAIIAVGALYHGYLNSSKWRATIGKRFMNIMMVSKNGEKLSFLKCASHYLLSLLPFFYVILLGVYSNKNQLSIYDSITGSKVNLILGLLFIIWTQIGFFTKGKSMICDIILKTSMIEGKISAKFPWKR